MLENRFAVLAGMLVVFSALNGMARGLSEGKVARFEQQFENRVERYFWKRCRTDIPASIDWESFRRADFKRRINPARQCAKPLFKLGGICESDFGWSARNNRKPKKAGIIKKRVKKYTCRYGGPGEQSISLKQGHLEFVVDFGVSEQNENFRSYLEFLVGERNCHSEARDQRRHGLELCQNDDHQLTYQAHWKDGKLDGLEKRWTRDGRFLKEEIHYKNDRKHGRARYFNEKDGSIKLEENYKNGQLHGLRKQYWPPKDGGRLQSLEHYQDGERRGKCERFYENGRLQKRGTYGPGGEWIGRYEYYTEKGILIERSNYEMLPGISRSAYHGKQELFDKETGKPKSTVHYRHGKYHGLRIEYDESGKPEKTCYQDGRRIDSLDPCTQ